MTWIVPQELLLDAQPGRPVALDPALDHAGKGRPAAAALAPGDAAGFGAAVDFRRPLAEALLQ
ncbi:hypothetical protein R0G64_07465, partial [Pseudomonas otitidis]